MSMLPKDEQSTVDRTKQSFREEVDINRIVARARQGAAVTHVARGVPQYLDVSEVGDYKGALDMLRATEKFFSGLPSKVRLAFNNDPVAFLDGMETVEGRAILEEAGLLPRAARADQPRDAAGRFAVDEDGDGVADLNPPPHEAP